MSAVLHATDSLPANALHVTRLEPTIGAEISGIDLRQPLTPALRDELRRLLLEHKVIFFRDQAISTEQQIAFAREFGELYVHPTTEQNDTTQPHAHLIQAQDARTLVLRTVLGAARMLVESDEAPAELRRRVTSPGGTTQAAIETFEAGGLRTLVADAVANAARRGGELSAAND